MREQLKREVRRGKGERVYGIYKLTSPSGKEYIGQGEILPRWSKYFNLNCMEQTALYRALVKYRPENFKYTVLCRIKEENSNIRKRKMDIMEICFIRGLDTMAPNGYNLSFGGGGNPGHKHTEETKAHLSQVHMGRVKTQEHCNNISKARMNCPNKERTDGRVLKALLKRIPDIEQYSLDGKLIATWESCAAAARGIGKPTTAKANIGKCTRGCVKTAYGFIWKKVIE